MEKQINQNQAREIKQKYLRDHIHENLYEDFGQFCESYTGGINIDSWNLQYLEELVNKFHSSREEEAKNRKTQCFHIFQTSDMNQIKAIAQQVRSQLKENIKSIKLQSKQKLQQKKMTAIQLLDSAFQTKKVKESDFPSVCSSALSMFESPNFWETAKKGFSQIKHVVNNKQQIFKTGFLENILALEKQNKPNNEGQSFKKNKNIKSTNSQNINSLKKNSDDTDDGFKLMKKSSLNKIYSQLSKVSKKIVYEGKILLKQNFKDTIICFKSTIRKALSHPYLKVTIQNHQIIHRNFFVSDYVMYHLKVLPSGIQCKRNYQDFMKLRKALGEVYPGIQLPYLQQTSWISQTNPQNIKKQQLILQYFINNIIKSDQLRNSRIFQDFLTISQHKKMKRKFEQYDKLQKLKCIQQLCLLSGKVEIKLTKQQQIFAEKFPNLLDNIQKYLQKHKQLSQKLTQYYQQILLTTKQLSLLMNNIQQQIVHFNQNVNVDYQINNLQAKFVMLKDIYQESYKNINFQVNILKDQIVPFLQYQKKNLHTLKDLEYYRNQFTKQYYRRCQNQINQDSSPYNCQKYKVFKKNINEESKNLLVFKYQTGYYNNQLCKQTQRVFELLGNKIAQKWSEIARKKIEKYTQKINFWEGLTIVEQSPSVH